MLRGVRPFLSDKYDLTKHPNYKYTADADKKYLFDMERYMMNIPPQTGQQNGGNRSRVTVEMSPGVRLQVQAVE